MTKKDLIEKFVAHLEKEADLLKASAMATRDAATNEESKPENEYDTFALEASYLAGAQAQRVAEVKEVIAAFKSIPFKDFAADDEIAMTAIVEVKLDGRRNVILMMPKGGGIKCEFGTYDIQIVTPDSVFGEAVMGLTAGDITEFEVGPRTRACEILSVR